MKLVVTFLFILIFQIIIIQSKNTNSNPSSTNIDNSINNIYNYNKNSNNNNRSIIFLNNSTKCEMYDKKCFVKIILTDSSLLTSLKVKSLSRKIFEFKSLEACSFNTSTILNQCKVFKSNLNQVYLLHIKPKLVGIQHLELEYLTHAEEDQQVVIQLHKIVVTRPERFIDKFQLVYIVLFSTIIAIVMGILLDTDTLIKIIKMPLPVLIGFISQYLFMPLLTYGFIKIFKLQPVEALALFIYGCSPGGSSSNNWTIIFNGDIDLSAIMTFVSTMSSLVMMPLWLYTLGRTISSKAEITIPIYKLALNLLTTIGPCIVGLVLSKKFPSLKVSLMKCAKNLITFMLISFLALTLISKYYIFQLITWQQWVSGPLIPWCGFLLGGFIAWLAKRPVQQIYTISIETGLQNVGIAFMIIMINFPSPESDYALLPLIAVSTITTLPLWVLFLVKKIFSKSKKYLIKENDKNSTAKKNAQYDENDKKQNLEQNEKLNI